MLAVGINEAGQREILGLETAFGETAEGWRRFIGQLKSRGLSGARVATSDAHEGLVQALREGFPGLIWQRCQAHFRRNVIDQTPSSYRDRMHQMLDQLLEASSQSDMQRRFEDVSGEIEEKAPAALEVLTGGLFDATAAEALPGKYRRRLRTTKRGPSALSRRSAGGRRSSASSRTWVPSKGSLAHYVRRLTKSGPGGPAVPDHGRVLRVESYPPNPRTGV